MTPVVLTPKETVRTTFLQKAALVVCSIALMLLVVCAGELYCRWFTRINFLGISRGMFVSHAYGDSYGNRPEYRGVAFGADVQTDSNGFRIDPTFRKPSGGDAALVLGDSVSFGVGVDASRTITGLLQRAIPQLRFYNASAIGYGLHDYGNVVATVLPRKPDVKHVLLFYCLNDIYDTSAQEIEAALQELNGTSRAPKPVFIASGLCVGNQQLLAFAIQAVPLRENGPHRSIDAIFQAGFFRISKATVQHRRLAAAASQDRPGVGGKERDF